jgi:hypothetical protein
MNNSKAMNTRITRFFFNHGVHDLSPAIKAVAVSERILKKSVVSRPDCATSTVEILGLIIGWV